MSAVAGRPPLLGFDSTRNQLPHVLVLPRKQAERKLELPPRLTCKNLPILTYRCKPEQNFPGGQPATGSESSFGILSQFHFRPNRTPHQSASLVAIRRCIVDERHPQLSRARIHPERRRVTRPQGRHRSTTRCEQRSRLLRRRTLSIRFLGRDVSAHAPLP